MRSARSTYQQLFFQDYLTSGAPIPLAIPVGLLIGLGVGMVNGLLVSRLKLSPFIATLGMLGIDPFYLQIAIGLLIIMAVNFDHLKGGAIKFLCCALSPIPLEDYMQAFVDAKSQLEN